MGEKIIKPREKTEYWIKCYYDEEEGWRTLYGQIPPQSEKEKKETEIRLEAIRRRIEELIRSQKHLYEVREEMIATYGRQEDVPFRLADAWDKKRIVLHGALLKALEGEKQTANCLGVRGKEDDLLEAINDIK